MSMQACPKCGTTVAVSEKSCPDCGQEFEQMQQKTKKKQRSFLAVLLGILGIRRNPQTGALGCAVVPAAISVATIVLVTVVVVGPVLKLVPPFASSPSSPRLGKITTFPIVGSRPNGITSDSDGNIWFTDDGFNLAGGIGRITLEGTITEFPIPNSNSEPQGITSSPDGNLWFLQADAEGTLQVERITPTGTITDFPPLTLGSYNIDGNDNVHQRITASRDGNIWFTESGTDQIGRITPSGTITEFLIPTPNGGPLGIVSGPDGNLWFTELDSNKIGRITPTGSITEFPVPTLNSGLGTIVAGPDGNLWFTELDSNKIGRITPTGSITEFPVPTLDSGLGVLAAGPDGNLWFTELTGKIGRMTPGGSITEFPLPGVDLLTGEEQNGTSTFGGMTTGPDGNLWFTEPGESKIGRITFGK